MFASGAPDHPNLDDELTLESITLDVPTLDGELPTPPRGTNGPAIEVTPLMKLQHIQRNTAQGKTSCLADVPVSATGRLELPPLLLAAVQHLEAGVVLPEQHHAGIEVVTIMLRGAVSYHDSGGGHRLVGAEDITLLSAGMGVEQRQAALPADESPLYVVLWLRSKSAHATAAPRYTARTIPRIDRLDVLRLVAAYEPRSEEVLPLGADVAIHTGVLTVGTAVTHELRGPKRAYVLSTIGKIAVDGLVANPGDRVRITGPGRVHIQALESTEVIVMTA